MEAQKVYQLSMEFSQKIWDLAATWPSFARETCGNQIVRSSDSISANLKEGMGRYFYKERNQFNIYARGSLIETQCWLEKALTRKLISDLNYVELFKEYNQLEIEINRMIRNTRLQASS